MSVRKTPYVLDWYVLQLYSFSLIKSQTHLFLVFREQNRKAEMNDLLAKGLVPHEIELQNHPEKSLQGLSCELNFGVQPLLATADICFKGLWAVLQGPSKLVIRNQPCPITD